MSIFFIICLHGKEKTLTPSPVTQAQTPVMTRHDQEGLWMTRPKLNQISLKGIFSKPGFVITMSIGQWDKFLEEGYFNQNAILLELDSSENPIAAYQKVAEDEL